MPPENASDLLFEIGVEELPASFVSAAVAALPDLVRSELAALRLSHDILRTGGTPRRLVVWVEQVQTHQTDLEEEVLGPPSRVAFDAAGKPTRAAEAFAAKSGVAASALYAKETPKGAYVAAKRVERGVPAKALLPAALERVCAKIPFRKSMRWSDGDTAFGRPVRWLLALLGEEELSLTFAGIQSGRTTEGHRFLGGAPVRIAKISDYADALRARHVVVDIDARKALMVERLHAAAKKLGGVLIEDPFLVEENASLVEEPHIVDGGFEPAFLALPERVILDVAKGHQRYFGLRGADGRLLPKYLAVVNTAEKPDNVRHGNDRVMRARLSDARFFYTEDLKTPLEKRRAALDGIVFHKRLGSVGDKVRRVERLVAEIGGLLGLDEKTVSVAIRGAALAKCDLVTLMVGELPELQGEMGHAYALAQGVDSAVADVIAEHYFPRGADDPCAASAAGALLSIAERVDTLTGSCAINVMPTGTADPLALRRAAIGLLRTLLERGWELSVPAAVTTAHGGFEASRLDLDAGATADRLSSFLAQRLRGLLANQLPSDVVDACITAGHDAPTDVARRARALATIAPEVRASAGEVLKRATNIAKDAPAGPAIAPGEVSADVHPSEKAVFDAFRALRSTIERPGVRDYESSLDAIARFAPVLGKFFQDVFVMTDDTKVRENRLRLMREIQRACSTIANFNLLAKEAATS
jgi:glycyl-tRNA synthetase beta chain